jgi:hypothetical protein
MPERIEFYLFRQYSLAIKNWLTETCYLSRYPRETNIQVVYSAPERAFAKYMYPVVNGQNVFPTITFVLTDSPYADGENLLGFVKETNRTGSNPRVLKPLLIYKLNYQVSIQTTLQSDADILQYQILSNATKNRKAAFLVDGQWCEAMAGNPRNETQLQPGDAQDRVIRYGLDLSIPRAYLPREYREYGTIDGYEIDFVDETNDEELV